MSTKLNTKIKCYFDNNATTVMPKNVIDEIIAWTNMGNPSADYCNAQRCRDLILEFRKYIATIGKFKISTGEEKDADVTPDHYRIIITSGASESNSLIIRSVVDSYIANVGVIPHIVTSSIEHKSILDTLQILENEKRITVTKINPTPLGFILSTDVEMVIQQQPHVALCTIMAANNETGSINEYAKIAKICHRHNIVFHTDVVQLFGKSMIYPVKEDVDAYSVSFHKLHGPIGVGMLVIKESFLRGFDLKSQIGGTQNGSFRGGTLNICGIAGAFAAMKYTSVDRLKTNEQLRNIKRHIISGISQRIPTKTYREYLLDQAKFGVKPGLEIIFISTAEEQYLPNTLLFSVVKRTKPDMCNGKLKKYLCDMGIIVSIGSACNTDSSKASHVLYSMGADELIRRGTIRVSLGDESTITEANIFIKELIMYLNGINN